MSAEGFDRPPDGWLAKVVEQTTDLVGMADPDARAIYMNPAGRALLGVPPDEVLRGTSIALFHPPWAARLNLDVAMPCALREGVWAGDSAFLHRDGTEIPCWQVLMTHRDADGALECFSTIARDLRGRDAIESGLAQREERFRVLAAHSSVGIWQITPDGYTLYINGAMCDMLEVDGPEALAETTFHRFFTDAALERMRVEHGRRTGGEASSYEVEILGARGGRRHALISGAPLLAADGALLSLIGTFVDVTARTLAERRREELEQQLLREQKMQVVGRMAGGVAHDFNNLLTPILVHTRRVLDGLDPASADARALGSAIECAERAAKLTRQLLAFSRRQVLARQTVDLNDVVRSVLGVVAAAVGDPIELAHDLTPARLPIEADVAHLEQVLLNLAINARDAMPGGGRLEIATGLRQVGPDRHGLPDDVVAGCYATLTLTDTGVGMDAETRGRAFEPFFTTKPEGVGSGLGLSIVYGVVKQHGGVVDLESIPSRGTRVQILLPTRGEPCRDLQLDPPAAGRPIVDVEPAADAAAGATAHICEGARGGGGKPIVLVVEDHPLVRDVIRDALLDHGYDVVATGDPEHALALSLDKAMHIDLLLTDLRMPRLNGRELYERVVAARPGVRGMFVSGFDGEVLSDATEPSFRCRLLAKPFTIEALLEAVEAALAS